MAAFKYILLALIMLNMASFGLENIGSGVGSALSGLTFGGLILFFFLNNKSKIIIPFVVLGVLYYTLSSLNYTGPIGDFLKEAIKYFIFILFAAELFKTTTTNELLIILLIGSLSIVINALVFPNHFGRYSGFYINPNRAGFICLVGFILAYNLDNKKYKLLAQFIFLIAGIMTLSRYFILLLVIVILFSVIANKKNLVGLFLGGLVLVIIFNFSAIQLNTERFAALKSLFSDNVDTKTITKESREETWALYTDKILDAPIIGNGYKSMQGNKKNIAINDAGVHNTYLMVIGESGIIPFLLIIIIYLSMLIRGIKQFSTNPILSYLALVLLTNLLVTHNYFDNYIILFIALWLYVKLKDEPEVLIPETI